MAFSTGGPVVVPLDLSLPELTEVEEALAWFKLTFGCLFLAVSVAVMARFYSVRNVFEIKARSPSLAIIIGACLMGVLGLMTFLAAARLFTNLEIDVYHVYYVFYFCVFTAGACFLSRFNRLCLAYSPRLRRRFPWMMNERLLVCCSLFIGTAALAIPLYKAYTINGPFAFVRFAEDQEDELFLCQVVLLGITIIYIPLIWHVNDLFKISTELFFATLFQVLQTGGNYFTDKYASKEVSYWMNDENIPFIGTIIMFSIVLIDPLRRLAFNPMSKTYPALARAQARRRQRGLRNLKKIQVSNTTDSDSWRESQDSQSASASELQTPRRRRWSYESLAGVPGMAASFRAFAFRALCQESVIFLEEIAKYQREDYSMCDADNMNQKAAFLAIVARFIVDGSPDEVNISYTDKKEILELSRFDAEKFSNLASGSKRTVFGAAYMEIRYILESNLIQRFTETLEFKEQELTVPPPPARSRRRGRANNFSNDDDVIRNDDNDIVFYGSNSRQAAAGGGFESAEHRWGVGSATVSFEV